ncbi:GntR family transcriptional regulator [Ensifer adhaerens]|uniref:GntR family transcriptional regulator n=1 Tax=Ensifer adhaerens TaxID=106592 RepID=UPI001CBEB502|nr:GntR family transcriptional regulator [Ensifer adhaerens]MBZ7924814.1 GntR family transcriptional regulator [Ensifer adhaerens]UAX95965.1 GntR family transcriptional regulator [Ensifer adhaerens]UAY04693.1 GntR family transcriptional regulator [Ensifer adhaerens]UAY10124.1 GntR family transcriptional regulator [Ensifer adhaerens]
MAKNVVQRLRDEIEDAILSNEFAPAERLDEMALAKRFGVSRTPVREALMQLNAIGLVEIRPRRGAIVVDPGPSRIYEMFEVMAELEGLAGSLAARRLTDPARAAILAAHDKCERSANAGDSDAYYYDNEQFHKAIYTASQSGYLLEQCTALRRRLRPYRRLQLRVRNRIPTSFSEHRAIVDSILAGDADKARILLQEHVAIQGVRFSDLVASMANNSGRSAENSQSGE